MGTSWNETLAPYARPRVARSLLDLALALPPYLALSVAMYFLIPVSYWLVLALADYRNPRRGSSFTAMPGPSPEGPSVELASSLPMISISFSGGR